MIISSLRLGIFDCLVIIWWFLKYRWFHFLSPSGWCLHENWKNDQLKLSLKKSTNVDMVRLTLCLCFCRRTAFPMHLARLH